MTKLLHSIHFYFFSFIITYVIFSLNSSIASTPTFLYGAGISALSGANLVTDPPKRGDDMSTGPSIEA